MFLRMYMLLEDGTNDKPNNECVAIGIRYVGDGTPKESILSM